MVAGSGRKGVRMSNIEELTAGTQAMGLPQFLAQANPMMSAVDDMMARMFGKPQNEDERRADLDRKEDEFIARKGDLNAC
jgi:hypothetical protein